VLAVNSRPVRTWISLETRCAGQLMRQRACHFRYLGTGSTSGSSGSRPFQVTRISFGTGGSHGADHQELDRLLWTQGCGLRQSTTDLGGALGGDTYLLSHVCPDVSQHERILALPIQRPPHVWFLRSLRADTRPGRRRNRFIARHVRNFVQHSLFGEPVGPLCCLGYLRLLLRLPARSPSGSQATAAKRSERSRQEHR
jgi:hypothetical protein